MGSSNMRVTVFLLVIFAAGHLVQSNGSCTGQYPLVPGPPGRDGRDGIQGVPGRTGDKGDRGETGSPGEAGMAGPHGPKGEKGMAGPQGIQGEKGNSGSKGDKGSMGPAGPKGNPGLFTEDDFNRVSQNITNELNESLLAEVELKYRHLTERVQYLEQQHNITTLCNIPSLNWRRIAYFDTTRGDPCPSGLRTFTNTTHWQTACGTIEGQQQTSLNFTTGGSYTHVCGRVRGYQGANSYGFYHHGRRPTIDNSYADGILITRGSPRQHLWTYASAFGETYHSKEFLCPCASSDYNPAWIPSFVGSNFYCESGFVDSSNSPYRIAWEDPLWDGKGCFISGNTCCDRFGWFHRQVPSTNDDIEVRWSRYYTRAGAETLTDQLEIWVM